MKSHIDGKLQIKKLAEAQADWDNATEADNEVSYKGEHMSHLSLCYISRTQSEQVQNNFIRSSNTFFARTRPISEGFGEQLQF